MGMSTEEKRRTLKRIYERKRCLPYILAGVDLGERCVHVGVLSLKVVIIQLATSSKAFASSCQPDTVNIGEWRCPGKQRIKEEKHKRNEDDADAFKKVYEKVIEQNLHLRSSAKTVYAKGMGLGFSDAMSF